MSEDNDQIKEIQSTDYILTGNTSGQENEKLKRFGFANTFFSSFRRGCRRGVTIVIPNSVKSECTKELNEKRKEDILL